MVNSLFPRQIRASWQRWLIQTLGDTICDLATGNWGEKGDQAWFYEIRNGYDPDKITGYSRSETPQQNNIP